jgi:hypothetical protein
MTQPAKILASARALALVENDNAHLPSPKTETEQ